MTEAIPKRPFARPLLIWVLGIVIQTIFSSGYRIAGCLLLFLFLFCIILYCIKGRSVCYDNRWVWGVVCLSLLLLLSMGITRYTQERPPPLAESSKIKQLALDKQQSLIATIDHLQLTDDEKSVMAALTIGYKKVLSRDVRNRFSLSGLSHLLAVSGFHVAIVCGFLGFMFAFLPRNKRVVRWLRYLLTMLLLWSFVFITGLGASAVRAGLMLSFYLAGRTLSRNADSYNTLAAAAFCMLVYKPENLFDIGFQLSYMAVFFILWLQPGLNRIFTLRNPLLAIPWGWVTVSIAAQEGTTFLSLFYFGQFSLVFLYANILVVPLATLLIPTGLIWMLLPDWVPGYDGMQTVVEWLVRFMLNTVEAFSLIPGATLEYRFSTLELSVAYLFLLFMLLLKIKNVTFVHINNKEL